MAFEGVAVREAAIEGRAEAFALLDARRLASAYRLASLILHDGSEGEDAVQLAIAVAWERWSMLRDPTRFEPWFDRILVNTCRDRLRRMRHRPVVEIQVAADRPASDSFSTVGDRDAIGRAFARLSADQRIAVVLRFYRDLPIDEIAARLGVPSGTVKSRLHAALAAMRLALDAGPADVAGAPKEAR